MKKPRVLIADDHALILDGIRKLLEPTVDLVGTAQNGRDLISSACRLKPDIVLLDISMPNLNGIEAARYLRKKLPDTKVIFMTMHNDVDFIADALSLDAAGYLLKDSAASELIEALEKVARGQRYVSPLVKVPSRLSKSQKPAAKLTVRQREILQLIAEGKCPKEISVQLGISIRTVEFHKYGIMKKLGVYTIAELTKYAIRHRFTGI